MKKVVLVVLYCSCFLTNKLVVFLVIVKVLDGLLELILDLVHALLEALDTLTQATHEFWYLPAAEQQKNNSYNEDNLTCTQIQKTQYSVQFHT